MRWRASDRGSARHAAVIDVLDVRVGELPKAIGVRYDNADAAQRRASTAIIDALPRLTTGQSSNAAWRRPFA